MNIKYEPTPKGHELWEVINDSETTQILFGGGAGSGKSFSIMASMILLCLTKPGIRLALCRKNYTTLRKTTMVSMYEVINKFGLRLDTDLKINGSSGNIKFANGSEIIPIELDWAPSEPNYERLQGLLLTAAFIDEVGELVDEKGYNILASRVGRWKNTELSVKPMIVSTCNPSQNFLKEKFYDAWKRGTLPKHLKFIPALITDNPHMDKAYIENLKNSLDEFQLKRLLYGDWDYSNDDLDLFKFQDIKAMYVKNIDKGGELYLSVDLAVSRDNTVGLLFRKDNDYMHVEDIIVANRDISNDQFIKDMMNEYKIPQKNIIYDASGVGNDLRRMFPLAKPFAGNSKVVGKENYQNIRHQCIFKLSKMVSENYVKMYTDKERGRLSSELQAHKRAAVVENRVKVIPKSEIKKNLGGASPDISDCFMMAMILWLKKSGKKQFA